MIETTERVEKYLSYTDMGNKNITVSVTEWSNGSGYDITVIRSNGWEERVSLSHEDLAAVNTIISSWYLKDKEKDNEQSK